MEAKQRDTGMQFLLYLAISSMAAIVNLVVGFSLYGVLGLSTGILYALSVAIGYLAGMGVNWSLNRVITFPRSGRRRLAEIRTFLVVALIGLLLTVVLAAALRNALGPYIPELSGAGLVPIPSAETTAQIMAVGIVAVYSFLSHKWFTFARGIRFQVARLGQSRVQRIIGWTGEASIAMDRSRNLTKVGLLHEAQRPPHRGDV